ncbi:hypothetical protein ABPG75_003292 [Micractinium tetrahymenae]
MLRLEGLWRHLEAAPPEGGFPGALEQQACAAHSTIVFARPAASDVRFGRPVAAAPSASDLAAAERALAVLRRAAAGAGAGAGAGPNLAGSGIGKAREQAPPSEEAAGEGLPRFARAVAAPQARTSPFAAALPAVGSGGGGMSSSAAATAGTAPDAEAAVHAGPATGRWRPELNMFEDAAGWTVEVALPGVRPADVRVELADRTLAVSGWRRARAAHGDPGLLPGLAALLPAVLGLPATEWAGGGLRSNERSSWACWQNEGIPQAGSLSLAAA